jgi:ABC-2 type transport system ATP-binding protein
LVKEAKARGKTIFMSSHIFSEMEETCDYVAFIKEGKLEKIIDMAALHHSPNSLFRVRFASEKDYAAFIAEKRFALEDLSPGEQTLVVEIPLGESQRLFQSLAHYQVLSFSEVKFTLEKCFDELIKEEA